MQWLIDIILSLFPPADIFVLRPSPGNPDFNEAVLTDSGGWQNRDLSGIVPVGTKAVLCHVVAQQTTINQVFLMRTPGEVLSSQQSIVRSAIINMSVEMDKIIALDDTRIIQTRVWDFTWTVLNLTIHGYWLRST